MNKILTYILLLVVIFFFNYDIYSQTKNQPKPKTQTKTQAKPKTQPKPKPKAQPQVVKKITIAQIIENEKNTKHADELKEIVNTIDSIYTNSHENLKNDGKIVVYIHSAHGRVPTGEWYGGRRTGRHSCTDIPEEYYSIAFSRKLYDLLRANPHIQVETHDEYFDVLNRKTDEYKHINFTAATQIANEKKSFIMVSQHLNNVAMNQRAGGTTNIPGFHILVDSNGNYYLGKITNIFRGFLTLYNKYDAGGFSKAYSTILRDKLAQKGFRVNSWDNGVVGDDRFIYYLDHPISVIYESGFISDTNEERKMADPVYQDIIVKEQYDALIEGFKNFWGFDISGKKPNFPKGVPTDSIEMMKLSRMAIYYLKKTETQKAVQVIDQMLKYDNKKFASEIKFYSSLKTKVLEAEAHYKQHLELTSKKKHKDARASHRKALKAIEKPIVFASYTKKYSKPKPTSPKKQNPLKPTVPAVKEPETEEQIFAREDRPAPKFTTSVIKKAPLERDIILIVKNGESLEKAIDIALAPSPDVLKKLTASFKNAQSVTYRTTKVKGVNKKVKEVNKISFDKEGIYIVKLDKNLNVTKGHLVKKVYLNPNKYQNQLYLKNSYFANDKKEKTL